MGRVGSVLVGGAAGLAGAVAGTWLMSSAEAADYPAPCVPPPQCLATSTPTMANPIPQCLNPPGPLCAMPPPQMVPVPVAEVTGGWYLRGDIGLSQQRVRSLHNALYNQPGTSVTHVGLGFDSAPTFGVGVGYHVNDWMRVDVTAEYRARANFKGSDNVRFQDAIGTGRLVDNYTGSKSELLFLLNAYLDLGTWWCVTPFIGAGVGLAQVTIHGFRDDGIGFDGGGTPIQSVAFADTASKWNFAYALHAGLAYKVSSNFAVELSYRYLGLGDGVTGDLRTFTGVNAVNNPMHFKNLTSQDLRLGVRLSLDGVPGAGAAVFAPLRQTFVPPPPPPPVQQVYIPQPIYQPPPPPPPAPVYQPPPQQMYPPPVYHPPVYQPPLMRRG